MYGVVYGRGVGENEGRLVAHGLEIEFWMGVDGDLPCNVLVLLEGEE